MQVWLAGELIVRCEHQGLTSLPPQLWLKTTLRTLVLTGNALACLPPDIQLLKELRELHLGHNQLVQLPDEVCLLSQLQQLDVQHNQLTEVPTGLCRCVAHTVSGLQCQCSGWHDFKATQLEFSIVQTTHGWCRMMHGMLQLLLYVRRLVHLSVLNLDGNPLKPALQQLWGTPAAGTSSQQQPALSGRQAVAAATSRVKDRTQAVLQHLLEQQVRCNGNRHHSRVVDTLCIQCNNTVAGSC
jgi:Leucine-rich repeat (LRR) protein